jgi:hypothetical protein
MTGKSEVVDYLTTKSGLTDSYENVAIQTTYLRHTFRISLRICIGAIIR